MKVLALLILTFSAGFAGISRQTDWSDGPGVPGPVNYFYQTFDTHQYIDYEGTVGELYLNLKGEKHQVTDYLEYSVPGSVADINGDGHLDVVCGSNGYSKREVYWFENDGSGGGWERHDVSGSGEVYYPWSVCAADVDGDGDMDVICGDNDKIVLWINTDGTGLNWETSMIDDNLPTAAIRVIPADIDTDSDQDILVQRAGPDGHLIWYENPLSDLSEPIDSWTEHFIGYKSPQDLCVADINDDGWLDVVSAANNSQPGYKKISFWENLDGTGDNWVENTICSSTPWEPYAVCAADIDNDGDLDVVAADWTQWVSWFENIDGTGHSWEERQVNNPVVSGTSLVTFDVDIDGDIDILGAFPTQCMAIWENIDGAGNNWRRHFVEYGPHYVGLSVGDIDGDDTLDVVGYINSGSISWYRLGYPSTGSLTSSILDVNNYPHWDEMQWQDSVPAGSSVRFRVRSSNDPGDMGEWSGYIEEPGSLEGFVDSTHRYFQYRVHMEPSGRFVTPTLYQVLFYWDWLGVEGAEEETCLQPVTPNPGSGPVEIRFSLAEPGSVVIQVFDLCGRLVSLPVDGEVSGGEHSVQLASLPPGAYFVRMTAGEEVLRERFVLVGN